MRDSAETLGDGATMASSSRRHHCYSQRMMANLGSLKPKDPRRSFGRLEREIIYWRDGKNCRVCGAEVLWTEAEIHHTVPHSQGGKTGYKNAVLVHQHCHPKSESATQALVVSVASKPD